MSVIGGFRPLLDAFLRRLRQPGSAHEVSGKVVVPGGSCVCFVPGCLWLVVACAVAQPAAPPKVPPGPSEGSISASGKFSPALQNGPTNTFALKTPAEAEAVLQRALSVRQTGSNTYQIGVVELDRAKRILSMPARVNIRTQIVEYALVTERGKAYESLLTTEAVPMDVQMAFLLLDAVPVNLAGESSRPLAVPESNALAIEVAWETNRESASAQLADLLVLTDGDSNKPVGPMRLERWLYNGSVFNARGFAAQQEGSIISLIRDPVAIVNNPALDSNNDKIHLPNAKLLPPEGWPVRVTVHLPPRPTAPPTPPPPYNPPITPLSTNRN